MQSKTQRPGWDTRTWAFGFVTGNVLGAALLALSNLGAHSPQGPVRQTSLILFAVVFVLGFLAVPAVTSGLARRRTFLWGLLPLVLLVLWLMEIDRARNHMSNFSGTNWWILPTLLTLFWVISSGPVSFVRWLLRRARDRQAEALLLAERLRASSSAPQEGVWPPPPDYHP